MKRLHIFEMVCLLAVCLNVSAAPEKQIADEIRLLEQMLADHNKTSLDDVRQTRERLERELPQYPDSPEKARAYLLAAKLELEKNEPHEDADPCIRLVAASLNIKQIKLFDEIEARFLYASWFVNKNDNQNIIEQCRQVRQKSLQCLNEDCYKTAVVQGTVTPFRILITSWGAAAEFEAEALEKNNKATDAVTILADFGNRVIPYAAKTDRQESQMVGFVVSTTWIKCVQILGRADQNDIVEPFTAALASFPDTDNNPDFEQVRIVLELARAQISGKDKKQSLQNTFEVIDSYAANPGLEKAVIYFIGYMKSPIERYKYSQKLLKLNQTHPIYKPSPLVYWLAGNTASTLEEYEEAIQIFEEFLQRFPTDSRISDVEKEIQKLKQMQEHP